MVSAWRSLWAFCWARVFVLPRLAVVSRPGGWQTRAPWAGSRTPIPTGSRRSGSCRRWRGTRSFPGPQPEARASHPLRAGRPGAASAAALVSYSWSGAQGQVCGSFGTTGFLTSDVFHHPFRKFGMLTGCSRYSVSWEVTEQASAGSRGLVFPATKEKRAGPVT